MFGVPAEFRDRVIAASEREDLIAAVHNMYARLQLEIDRRQPVCVASGKCCHFEPYGHRLYVTTLEMAAFVRDLDEGLVDSPGLPAGAIKDEKLTLSILENPGGCQFQIDKLCSVHAIRPFGCRIFFCDSTATQWQQQQYEAFHAKLRQLHEQFNIDYFYVEWRQALTAVGFQEPRTE